MSRYAYDRSARLAAVEPLDALLMACLRKSDTDNFNKLAEAFPVIAQELRARYDAPGGALPHERENDIEGWH